MKTSLLKSVAILTIFSILTRFLGFVLKIIFSHTLTPEMIGIYSIVSSIFMVLTTMVAAGLPLVVSRIVSISVHENDKNKSYRAVTCGTVIGLTLSIIVCLAVLILKPLIIQIFDIENAYDMLLITLPGVLFTGIYAGIRGYFWGQELYTTLSVVELIEQIIRIVSCVILFYFVGSISIKYVPTITLSLSVILSTILGFIIYFRLKGKFKHASKREYKDIILTYAPITGMRITSSLLSPIIHIMLPLRLANSGFSNTQALALLGIISGMTLPLLSIPQSIIGSLAMALIPRISTMYNKRDVSGLKQQIQQAVDFTLCCSFLVIPIFLSMGVPICKILFSSETAGQYLAISCILLIPQGISMLSSSILNSLSCEKTNFLNSIIGSVGLILSIYFLPKYCEALSLIYGLLLSSVIISILNFRKITKLVGIKIHFTRTILRSSIVCLMISIMSYLMYPILATIFPNIVAIFTQCIIDCIIFITLMDVFGIMNVTYFKGRITAKFKKNKSKTLKTRV